METHTDNTLQATSNQLAAIQLSPHFTLGEMLQSRTAETHQPSVKCSDSRIWGSITCFISEWIDGSTLGERREGYDHHAEVGATRGSALR